MTQGPQPLTVLVLDDEASIRDSLRRFLQLYGYVCVEADTVDAAVRVLESRRIDAVILDVRLPDQQSGLDVLAPLRSRAEFERVPVLILTGGVLTDKEEALITRQRAHIFYKPEGFDTLLNFLDQLTGRDRAH